MRKAQRMKTQLRRRRLARSLHASAVLAALCFSAPARADSAVGADTVLGNGLNPTGLDPTVPPGKAVELAAPWRAGIPVCAPQHVVLGWLPLEGYRTCAKLVRNSNAAVSLPLACLAARGLEQGFDT